MHPTGGYNAFWAGITMGAFGIGALIGALFYRIVKNFTGIPTGILIGLILSAISFFYQANTLTTESDLLSSAYPRFILGIGLMLCFILCTFFAISEIDKTQMTSASGLFHFFRSIFSATGTTLIITLWQRRISHYTQDLGSSITSYSDASTNIFSTLKESGFSNEEATETISSLVNSQSALLALNDCLWSLGWVCTISAATLLVFVLYKQFVPLAKRLPRAE